MNNKVELILNNFKIRFPHKLLTVKIILKKPLFRLNKNYQNVQDQNIK